MNSFFLVTQMQKFTKSIAPIVCGGLNQLKLLKDNTTTRTYIISNNKDFKNHNLNNKERKL
jgi:hypothetical protein